MHKTSWHDIYSERLLWAENAYQSFIEKFDSDRLIKLNENNKKQVSIIVYGSTQVGKTTFILTLLGINEDKISQVDKVLRAEQTLGNSATSRSSRYRCSEDQYWHFSHREKGKEQFDDEEALAILKELRTNVEKGKITDISTIDIFIPNIYFMSDANDKIDLLIHDLPGINARNENENSYVKELVGNYISAADMIFLVGKIDGLGFLKENELDNKLLSNWYLNSTVYKIILTHSFSNATIKKKISNDEINSLDSFNQYLFEQINTMELKLPLSIKEQIYPIECGRSWNAIIKEDDQFKQKSLHLRNIIFDKLYQDIELSMNPLSRLKTGYMLPEYLKQQKNKEVEDYLFYIKNLESEMKQINNLIDKEEKKIQINNKKLNRLTKEIKEISNLIDTNKKEKVSCLSNNEELKPIYFKNIKSINNASKSVESLQSILACEKERIIDAYNDWIAINNNLLTDRDNSNDYLSELLDFFYDISSKLEKYTLDSYFFDSSYNSDVSDIVSSINDAQDYLFNKTKNYIDKYLNEKKNKNKKLSNMISLKIRNNNTILNKNRVFHSRKLEEIIKLKEKLNERILKFDDSINSSNSFSQHIYESYEKRMHELNMLFKHSVNSKDKKLAYLFLIHLLRKDFLYIKNLEPLM
ncbi:hypothetical protein I4632_10105 [Proteus mirabilis]|uniref:coiled-coil domain-containing protein n=1 Tax=Proteus vulgaris TaxID=585 RepID=UPI0018C73D5A|nr:hypothetical protein [Proteus vulgaris]MBG3080562.1 hypothetical protein [Proteus mirabilis]QPN88747.1 hypothetical protein IM703_13160 [Proteus vulgaris]